MTDRHALARVLTVVALAAAVSLTACGDDDDEKAGGTDGGAAAAAEVALELKGSGKNLTMDVPGAVEGGTARVTFQNSTKKEAVAQLVRIEGDHTAKEALAAAEAWGDGGKPLPEWVRLAGGAGNTKPGESSTVTQPLPAGKYLAVDINSNTLGEMEVSGGEEAELPAADARIEAIDYGFESSGLQAGKSEVVFENTGKEPHFVVGLPIKPGKTIEDVKKFIKSEKGEPPIEEESGTFDSSLINGGGKQVVELDLKEGKYAFLCFIPDRAGGPPHVAKGMVAEAVVG